MKTSSSKQKLVKKQNVFQFQKSNAAAKPDTDTTVTITTTLTNIYPRR